MKTIYLAGKVEGRKWKVVPKHPLVKYVASDGNNHSEHNWAIASEWKPLNNPDMAEAVQEKFIDVLKKSVYLFAYLDTPNSYGSIAEIAYASALGIPCTVVVNDPCKQSGEVEKDWTDQPMADAYWFVSNFPLVHSLWADTEEHATELFTRFLGFALAESPVESQLWGSLLGFFQFPYRKPLPIPQYAINGYRLDFAWPDYKLAVEVDGHDYHKTKEQRSYDAKRDRDLLKLGWTTLRFTGSDVFRDVDMVASEVISILAGSERVS